MSDCSLSPRSYTSRWRAGRRAALWRADWWALAIIRTRGWHSTEVTLHSHAKLRYLSTVDYVNKCSLTASTPCASELVAQPARPTHSRNRASCLCSYVSHPCPPISYALTHSRARAVSGRSHPVDRVVHGSHHRSALD